jgi:enamine deaminase RidA (YjgF/YER057c/UK114 family)
LSRLGKKPHKAIEIAARALSHPTRSLARPPKTASTPELGIDPGNFGRDYGREPRVKSLNNDHRETMTGIERLETGPRFSHAVIHNGVVYLSGVVSHGASVRDQTKNVLKGVDHVLKRAGTDKSKILSATVWLTDMGKFDEMNSVWDKWVSPGNAPARVCVEAKLAIPDFAVEIAVIAAR